MIYFVRHWTEDRWQKGKMKETKELDRLMKSAQMDFAKFVGVYAKRLDAAAKGESSRTDGASPADAVSSYLHDGFLGYIRALEYLKTSPSSVVADRAAEAMADEFLKLDQVVSSGWKGLGRKPHRSFYRTSLIVRSVCKPDAFEKKGMPSVFKGDVSPRTFRRMAVDRSCKAIYGILAWLRDESRNFDRQRG